MYYEERWIGSCLYFRTTPDGEWQKATYELLTRRLRESAQ